MQAEKVMEAKKVLKSLVMSVPEINKVEGDFVSVFQDVWRKLQEPTQKPHDSSEPIEALKRLGASGLIHSMELQPNTSLSDFGLANQILKVAGVRMSQDTGSPSVPTITKEFNRLGTTQSPTEIPLATADLVTKFLNSKRNDLVEDSFKKYLGSFKTFSKAHPYLPVTPEPIEDYLSKRPAQSSKRYIYALLTELYEFAHERLGVHNVMERIKRPRKGKSKESDYLTLEQLRALLEAIEDDRLRGMVYLMAGLGFRRSEVHRVNVGDIFEDKIRCHGKESREWLPLLSKVRDLLLKLSAGRSGDDPLFTGETTGKRLGVERMNVIVRRLFKQAGINGVRPSPHTLRHTYCTLMQAAGCDRFSVELLMRHRTQNTTDVYTHTSIEQRLQLLRPKLEQFSPLRLVNGHKPSTGNLL